MKTFTPPTLAEVIQLQDHAPHSLEAAAASINRHIDLFTRAAGTFEAHRISAGRELVAARNASIRRTWNGPLRLALVRKEGSKRSSEAAYRAYYREYLRRYRQKRKTQRAITP